MDSRHAMPAPNHKYLRLYGHTLCPFVERARLVLAAKGLPYQDCEVNLLKRTRWHYTLNGGFVPILQTPSEGGIYGDKASFILESRIIMDYLDAKFKGTGFLPLYEDDPIDRAGQEMLMAQVDGVAGNLFQVLMSRGHLESSVNSLTKAMEKLNHTLAASKTHFFSGKDDYDMVDLYAFPHISRLFYLKDSALHDLYQKFEFEKKYIYIFRWFKEIRARPELNDGKAIIPVRAFHLWLEELKELPIGKKPPLRLPMKL